MAALLAVAAAAVYGAADFFGGLAAKRNPAARVVFLSQCFGIPVLAIAAALSPLAFTPDVLRSGIFAGVAGVVAIVALYAALAVGRMGVISPITAVVGAAIPVAVSALRGDHAGPSAIAGIACAGIAIVMVSADFSGRGLSLREPGLALAILSGGSIGLLYVFLAGPSGGIGRLIVARATTIAILACYCALRREIGWAAAGTRRAVAAAGVFDMLANVFYVFAAARGSLAVVAVCTSLYPASTVLLAFVLLRERLGTLQWTGVAFAFAGVVLIAL